MELRIDKVTKKFKDILAVNNLSVSLSNGIYGLLGPNGSGKTTLLRIIADVMTPTEGNIYLEGKSKKVLEEDYRDLLGYMPQEMGFYKNFTPKKFLYYISELKGIDKREAKEKIGELLKFVNLEKDKNKKIGRLSGGMRQRLGIAQALLNDPKILILDEPTAGLDPNERIRFKNLISNISKDKIVILSTHIVSDVEFIANEILIMKEGALIGKATPSEFIKKLRGKVWSLTITEDELYELDSKYKIVNTYREKDSIVVRIVGDEKPLEYAKAQEANLEDVFFYYIGNSLRKLTTSIH
ncbi:ABC transporter ATP-binding protein [Clostridium tagluense]|uniref:ABC transporter ATP-binding protein n=1 Tax=Clostridium tagluense TaxID=360422 RepID=UPI001C0B2210|nr:ABC transporter ATP-binding protein [Clostridium tagluense]MBU3127219.1 ABC transporter ATP-binding protein [Clostridium tagluense]MCB2312306.1 ABC transporter ATP-binding protein [Clostridium tagluense]MCB2316956.1 ABC transporter ATP-binding protein [Clostridium tagluense]MCB2321845.1 ABC transporter ATP-binding protein [Clostridium tagluense]MCB2326735.1 ABC transporter ATP-binding protein [Clostridium tagluense]